MSSSKGPNGWETIHFAGKKGATVKGAKVHVIGPLGQPLCDCVSYTQSRWMGATVADAVTCLHCLRAFGLEARP